MDENNKNRNLTLSNSRIKEIKDISTPLSIIEQFPLSKDGESLISRTRAEVSQVIRGLDDRLLVIVGPCSIHDPKSALEYAERLKPLLGKYEKDLLIVMRVYFEKPRTTVGWKGLINDPNLDNTFDINKGLMLARELLVNINSLGVPCAGEFLDTMTPQYLSDLISWGAIGARTTESQLHRELASGISCPVGFKNGTNGSIKVAIDAMISASNPHTFLGLAKSGKIAIIETNGNQDVHLILRGGTNGTNYDKASVEEVIKQLSATPFYQSCMIDCSHDNSLKDFRRQPLVCKDIAEQIEKGSYAINGVMIESNLLEGNQILTTSNKNSLVYGKSITDGCVSWETTLELFEMLAQAVQERRKNFPR